MGSSLKSSTTQTFTTDPYKVKYILSATAVNSIAIDLFGNLYYACGVTNDSGTTPFWKVPNFVNSTSQVFGNGYDALTTSILIPSTWKSPIILCCNNITNSVYFTIYQYNSINGAVLGSVPISPNSFVNSTAVSSSIVLIAGTSGAGYIDSIYSTNNNTAVGLFPGNGTSMAVDKNGALYIADTNNFVIRVMPTPNVTTPPNTFPIIQTYAGNWAASTATTPLVKQKGLQGISNGNLITSFTYSAADGVSPALIDFNINVIISSTVVNLIIRVQCIVIRGGKIVSTFPTTTSYWLPVLSGTGTYLLSGEASFKVNHGDIIQVLYSVPVAAIWNITGGNMIIKKSPVQTGGNTMMVSMNPTPPPPKSFIRKSSIRIKRGNKVRTKKSKATSVFKI